MSEDLNVLILTAAVAHWLRFAVVLETFPMSHPTRDACAKTELSVLPCLHSLPPFGCGRPLIQLSMEKSNKLKVLYNKANSVIALQKTALEIQVSADVPA